jgi:oligopeptide transport system permease protein
MRNSALNQGPVRLAVVLLFLITLFALLGPWIRPYTYAEIHLEWKNAPPSSRFWFGTDELGRDLFCRAAWGARISLFVGLAAALIDVAIGLLYGASAAYAGGKTDEAMMRVADILSSIPYLLTVILLTAVRGSGLGTLLIAMTCTGWIHMARISRAQVLSLKEHDFILAARSIGASSFRILFRHLLPNAVGPLIAAMTLTIPAAIFTEAFLSFLGLGVQAPASSWGVMVSDAISAMRYHPHRLFFPSLLLSLTLFAFNLLGNALSDHFDPRSDLSRGGPIR